MSKGIHPLVDASARLLIRAGWRVTSIIRPNSRVHKLGEALDAAPWKYSPGLVGPRTAKRVGSLLYNQLGGAGLGALTVIAEPDHIHAEVSQDGFWRIGTMGYGKTKPLEARKIMYDEDTLTLAPADVIRDPDALGDRAMGDPELEFEEGDLDDDDSEAGDPRVERALAKAYEMMDPEIGASLIRRARKFSRKLSPHKLWTKVTRRALRRGAPRKHKIAALAAVARATRWAPNASEVVMLEAYRNPSGPAGAPFIYVDTPGVTYDGGTIAAKRRMRPAHADAVLASALSTGLFNFQNFNFVNSGANMVLDIDSALNAVLPIASIFNWVGLGIYIAPRAFDAKLTFPFSVLHQLGAGAGNVQTANFKTAGGVKGATLWITNSLIFSDEAAPKITPVTVAAAPSGNFRSTITGLDNTVYTAVGRFLLPGDSSLAHIYRMFEASER